MTNRYAVIGNPISHTKSPLIYRAFARATRQDTGYIAIEGALDGFRQAVENFRARGGRGVNVTAPFKRQAFELATYRTKRARLAGTASALKFEGKRILADNFDGLGLVTDIRRNLGVAPKGRRVLLLGTGGAVRGVLLPFLEQRPAELVIADSTGDKAHALAEEFASRGPVVGCSYADLGGERFGIVVNATAASLKGELPPVAPEVFGDDGLAYEMVYGMGLTPFLRLAQNAGVRRLADGVGMLVEQAAETFVWWHGVRPDTRPVIDTLTAPLA